MKFTKMHGTGNDFVIIDDREEKLTEIENELAVKLCHRRFGIGADGLVLVRKKESLPYMKIINSDGSNTNMCGNAIRCFAAFIYKNGIYKKEDLDIYTDDGIKKALIEETSGKFNIMIDMGGYSFSPKDIPALIEDEIIDKEIHIGEKVYRISSLLLGVPHTVIFYEDDIDDVDVEKEGKIIEKYSLFPEGTNVNFCRVMNKNELIVKTWERGAGATFSCGTGSCASVVCGNHLGFLEKEVIVTVPGGKLKIEIIEKNVYMTGEAVFVFDGNLI